MDHSMPEESIHSNYSTWSDSVAASAQLASVAASAQIASVVASTQIASVVASTQLASAQLASVIASAQLASVQLASIIASAQLSLASSIQPTSANSSTFTSSSLPHSSHTHSWCADTGATSHMTPHRHWFTEYQPYKVPVRLADGTVIYTAGVGSILFKTNLGRTGVRDVVFSRVLHVPALHSNLLSVLYLTGKKGFQVVMEKNTMSFQLDGKLIFTATQRGGLAYLDGSTLPPYSAQALAALSLLPLTLDLWHRRLSHINYVDLKRMVAKGLVTGLKINSSSSPNPVCEPCIAGKQTRIVNKTATRTTVPLAIVHCDLHGPMPVRSPEGHRFFMVFVDDATRLWAVYFLKAKSDAPAAFWAYKATFEKQTGHKVKVLHDDKEGGLSSNEFNAKLNECGILRRFTMRAEPHSNGVAERAIRSLANDATSMLYESQLPASFWNKAVSTAVHKHNRSPTAANNGKVPYTCMYGVKPDVSLFRVFGSLAFVHVKKDKRSGFSPHMEKAIFVGYPSQYKGWEFFSPSTKKFMLSDRADFDERVFPGLTTVLPDPPLFPSFSISTPSLDTHTVVVDTHTDGDEGRHNVMRQQVGDLVGDQDADASHSGSNGSNSHSGSHPASPAPFVAPPAFHHQAPLPAPPQVIPVVPDPQLRRSVRSRVPANIWKSNWHKAAYRPEQHRVPPPPLPIEATK